jgi:cell division transport system permease protein
MIGLLRVIKFALQNFWRNFWLSVITISMLILTLLTVNILLVLTVLTDTAINAVEDKVDVSVYFNAETSEETVRSAAGYLRGLGQVRDVEIITPAEALERFRDRHAGDQAVLSSLEEVGENPFGYTLVIRAYNPDDFDFILEALDSPQYRDQIREKDFSNYSSIIQNLTRTTDSIKLFGLILSAIFLLIAILIIFNTVRITIFVHREEIAIMKLVGATNWFVKAPYYIEALLYCAIAVAVSAAIMYPTIGFLEPKLDAYFVTTDSNLLGYFIDHGPIILGAQFLGLFVISILSTGYAMRRYLTV